MLDCTPRHDLAGPAVLATHQFPLRLGAVSENRRVGLLPVLELESVVQAGVELVARALAFDDNALHLPGAGRLKESHPLSFYCHRRYQLRSRVDQFAQRLTGVVPVGRQHFDCNERGRVSYVAVEIFGRLVSRPRPAQTLRSAALA